MTEKLKITDARTNVITLLPLAWDGHDLVLDAPLPAWVFEAARTDDDDPIDAAMGAVLYLLHGYAWCDAEPYQVGDVTFEVIDTAPAPRTVDDIVIDPRAGHHLRLI